MLQYLLMSLHFTCRIHGCAGSWAKYLENYKVIQTSEFYWNKKINLFSKDFSPKIIILNNPSHLLLAFCKITFHYKVKGNKHEPCSIQSSTMFIRTPRIQCFLTNVIISLFIPITLSAHSEFSSHFQPVLVNLPSSYN